MFTRNKTPTTHHAIRTAMACVMLGLLAMAVSRPVHAENTVCTLNLWTTETQPERMATIRYLAQAFNAINPDIHIDVTGIDENAVRHMGDMAGQEMAPDILACESGMIMAMACKGQFDLRLTGTMVRDIGINRFSKGILQRISNSRSTPCGIPISGWVQGIWYRKDWFEKAGLAAPDTPERILAAAKTLHDPANDRYGILLGKREDVYAEQVFTHLALANGVEEYSPDGRVLFDSPEAVNTLRLYRELANYSPPGPQYWRGRDFYLQGKLAMMFYSTFIMDDLALPTIAADSLTPDNFPELGGSDFDPALLGNTGMVSVITGARPASYGVIQALGIATMNNERKRQAARRLVRFLYRPDAYITWLHMVPGGMLPVLRDVANSKDFYRDTQGVFRRYTHSHMRQIVAGLGSIESFGLRNGVIVPQAFEVSAEGILPAMITRCLSRELSPRQAVQWAAGCMREMGWSGSISVH